MALQNLPLLVIGGPTASGKTALAISLAKRFHGEIISADSMQMYRGMDIATAKPTLRERQEVPHHLLDILRPEESFSVSDYVNLARPVIAEVQGRGCLPILAGGTGQYISAIVDHLQFSPAGENPELRRELRKVAEEKGNDSLYKLLVEADPHAAKRIHPNNLGRVVRALEVYRLTGRTMTEMVAESRKVASPYNSCVIALGFRDRQQLYDRIDSRVDAMVEAGLVEEASAVLGAGLSPTAAQAIGYKELAGYLSGKESLEEAVGRIKLETRRYAKRQMTWFRRVSGVRWLYVDEYPDWDSLVTAAELLARVQGILE